ncbi:bacterial proteasome activator family protein [Arthrobacter sp. AL12]|uniref:bacterial proteasome activator family protein n=1 Tax=Arthrobacter sp. AL12 TaxID=3042241 RepID=UPI00249A89C4|nr:bacterial proteasome activator family protein [Arthrobacter sp. AL12]MDI3213898.1 bacterial proteasome activator family protein [Arthrobacter sp. AL12]
MSDPHDTQPGGGSPLEGATLIPRPAGDDANAARDQPLEPGQPGQPGRLRGQGQPVQPGQHTEGRPKTSQLQGLVDEPAKVMRIGTMMKQLLDEVKSAPLDDAARVRLAEIHERSIKELEDGLAPELVEELERITLPFPEDGTPSDAELRIAQAQLVGWLEGLFHGIQTALAAQHAAREHAAAQAQLRQLPPGTVIAPGVVIGENGEPQRAAAPRPGAGHPQPAVPADPDRGPGQYL